jgi:carboxypeptidase T
MTPRLLHVAPHVMHLGVASLVLFASIVGTADAAGGQDERSTRLVRIDLDDYAALSGEAEALVALHFDPCAIDREGTSRHAVLFLEPAEIDALRELGVAFEDRGTLFDHMVEFAPRNTMRATTIDSLEGVRRHLGLPAPPAQAGGPCEGIGISLEPYDRYHSLAEGTCFLNNLAEAYPNIARVVSIGETGEGREIWAIKITDNPDDEEPGEQKAMFTGVTHAREWATHEAVLYLAERLTSGYADDPQVKHIVDNAVVWLVPVVNPDGYEYTWTSQRLWRKNRRINEGSGCRGVDINRNYAVQWGYDDSGSSGSPCSDLYRGASPASEPETTAIQELMQREKFAIGVSYHTYSQLVLFPWGYEADITAESFSAHRAVGRKYAELVEAEHGQVYYPGQEAYTLYPINGGYTDFGYGDAGAHSFLVEQRPTSSGGGGFELPEDQIRPNAEENAAGAMWMMLNVADARTARNPRSTTLIESPGPGENMFSLPLSPAHHQPQVALGFPVDSAERLWAWLDDALHAPPGWGTLGDDYAGVGAGSGYVADLDAPLLAWAQGLRSYEALPYVFEDGADVMLSNVSAGLNVVGIPGVAPVPLRDVRVIKRVITPTGRTWGYREVVQEERTALEDLDAPSPWLDWTWEWVDADGQSHSAHPTGSGGASLEVEPYRAYNVQANVSSYRFGSTSVPVYLLRFPGFVAPEECVGDVTGDGDVGFDDVLAILAAWGDAGGPEDLDGSGFVDFGDLLLVLNAWGPCA